MNLLLSLIILVSVSTGVGVLLNKFIDNTVGSGLGKRNNERWGIVSEKERSEYNRKK